MRIFGFEHMLGASLQLQTASSWFAFRISGFILIFDKWALVWMMPAVKFTPFTFLLVIFANPILFAVNYDAVTFELCHVPCHFGARNMPFAEHNSIIRLENIVTTGASGGKGRGPRGFELIDLNSEGPNLGIPWINFAPISIDFHVVELCPRRGNNSMRLNPVIGSSAKLNAIYHSLNKCVECGVGACQECVQK